MTGLITEPVDTIGFAEPEPPSAAADTRIGVDGSQCDSVLSANGLSQRRLPWPLLTLLSVLASGCPPCS
ncbi:hypothetical protein ABH935_006695 [Catenulispora sp. GAS73]